LKSIVPSLKKEKRFDGSFILNNIMGRSADEYYQILLEKPKDKENNKNGEKGKEDTSGYDNHESWSIDFGDIDPEDDESDGEGGSGEEDSAEGEGKDPSQGNSKGEKDSEEDESENESDAQSKPTNEAIGKRGKKYSGVNKHQGFNDIISKNEIKSALKEILNSMGVDVNDPEEVRKGLESVPGLQKHGATISSIFKVKTKNWKQMLQNFLTYSANVMEKDYTMSRESRIRPDLFPGKKFENGLECVIITDTSGSVSTVDWNDFCNQIKRIAKDFNAKHMRVLQCHTRVTFDRKVDISKINKMEIMETGGTIMQVAFEKLKREKNRFPVILFTDGEIDRFNASDYPFKTLVFVSRGHSYTKPIIENCGFKVICQDEE
jgi:predicted metal-dependent peptidase